MKNSDLHRNIVAQLSGTRQTLLHFYVTHDIIKKVSPETRLAIHRIEACIARSPCIQYTDGIYRGMLPLNVAFESD